MAEKRTGENIPVAEFHQFRWAHANANTFLLGAFLVVCLVFGLVRWFLGLKAPPFFSPETSAYLVAAAVIALLIPRFGFYLARYIWGFYYQTDNFGKSYAEYRTIERRHRASKHQLAHPASRSRIYSRKGT